MSTKLAPRTFVVGERVTSALYGEGTVRRVLGSYALVLFDDGFVLPTDFALFGHEEGER